MNLYPRSFLRLIMLGWLLMAFPLLLAIAWVFISLTELSGQTSDALEQSAEAMRVAWEHEEDLGQMEKTLRRFEVLHDAVLLEDFERARSEWLLFNSRISEIPFLGPLQERTHEIRERELRAYQILQSGSGGSVKLAYEILADVRKNAVEMIDEIRVLTDAETKRYRARTDELQRQLAFAVISACLLAGVIFFYVRHIVAKLLRRVEQAVIVLGNNLLDRRIQFTGPEDLQWIGSKLDWLRRRLRSLEEERRRILRHVSHELKTPLAALREGSSLLSEGVAGPLSPQQSRIADIMQGNVLRLQELIDGLLRLQHAEHLRGQIRLESIQLDKLIKEALATHQLAARNKRLRFAGSLVPLSIEGGREEVTAIVGNLMSNAIKFSPEKSTIKLILGRSGEQAVLDVIDEGPGIHGQEREQVFEPFYRTADARGTSGAGLGLAIAREFVLALRGTIELLDSAGGAHFRVKFPLSPEAQP